MGDRKGGFGMKIAYIGIDLFFPALKELEKQGCEILKIFSCKTDNITEFNIEILAYAEKNKIPYTLQRITKEDISELVRVGCEAIICAGYYYRIPVSDEIPMINIHPTLLPLGGGSWPMPVIILKRHKKSGVTFHKIAEEFDAGDIVLQREFLVEEKENHETYMEKVYGLLPEMISELIQDFSKLYDLAVPQKEGEYWQCPGEDSYTITPDMTVEETDLILRAFYGYECIYQTDTEKYVLIKGKTVKDKGEEEGYFKLKDGYVECANIHSYSEQ